MSTHDQFDLEAMRMAVNYKASIAKRIVGSLNGCTSILDLGAGRGDFASLVYTSTGTKPLCVEVDEGSIPYLVSSNFDVHRASDTITAVDGIYSINVLEHIENPAKFLSDFTGKLSDGGTAFIYVPALPSLFSKWDIRVGHYHRFTKESIEAVVKASGLHVVSSGYTDPFGAVITFTMKTLKMGDKPLSPFSVYIYDRLVYPLSEIMESVFGRIFGKNVWVIAKKPSSHKSDTNLLK